MKHKLLSDLILEDIQRRGLREGDTYLGTREVAAMLGVSTMAANRALQELAEQQVLVRKQRSGTVIGQAGPNPPSLSLRCLHILIPSTYTALHRTFYTDLLLGFRRGFPSDSVELVNVPPRDETAFVRTYVESLPTAGRKRGFILVQSPAIVQRYFAESDEAAVIAGTPYPGVTGLPWVDTDQTERGRLLIEYVLARGHTHVALILWDRLGYGDNIFFEGVQKSAGELMPPGAWLRVNVLPLDQDTVMKTVRQVLSAPTPPSALICRPLEFARWAVQAVEDYELRVPEDVLVVCSDAVENDPKVETPVEDAISKEMQGFTIGELLDRRLNGGRLEVNHQVFPVRLSAASAAWMKQPRVLGKQR